MKTQKKERIIYIGIMIIIINNKIIDGVKIDSDGYPIIPKDIISDNDSATEWPYIFLPSINDYQKVECEIGYWDIVQLTKKVCPIVFGNVSVLSISVNLVKEQLYHWTGGFQYYDNRFKLYYHYEISLGLNSANHACIYNFKSDDYLEINDGQREALKLKTMKCMFKTIIPMLNEYILQGHPIDLLNKCYVQSCFPQKENDYIQRRHIHDFNRFKQIVYSSEIVKFQDSYFLRIGNGTMPFINRHISEVISDILGVRFLRESNDRYIYGIVTKLLVEIGNLKDLILPYCMAKLFFNAERYYSAEIANRELLLAVSSDTNESFTTNQLQNLYIPTTDVVRLFDFIFNIEAIHKIEGQYRAGRDDKEWEITKITFPLKDNFTPKEKLIWLINNTLGIKLEYKEDKGSTLSPQSRQYCYIKIENDDYVPWMARDEDRGSAELKQSSMTKIFDKIYNIYKSDEKEFLSLFTD